MNHRIRCWLLSVVAGGMLTAPLAVQGQQPTPPKQPPGQPPGQPPPKTGQPTQPGQPKPGQPQPGQPPAGQPATGQPATGQPPAERRPPALEYALAMIAALLVLVIICMPSRKG